MKLAKTVSTVLCVLAFIIGLILLFVGVKDAISLSAKTKDWFESPGYFRDYSLVGTDKDGKPLYKLEYVYYAGGEEYFVKTEYNSGVIPNIDSQRAVLWNPENPAEAIIKGGTNTAGYIFGGLMFVLVPSIMAAISALISGKFKITQKSVDFASGAVILIIGEIFLYIIGGSLLPFAAFQSVGLIAIIPTLLSVAGIFQISKIFWQKENGAQK